MARWIENDPLWAESAVEWAEGNTSTTPPIANQWVEFGWIETNPSWVEANALAATTRQDGIGWEVKSQRNKKIKGDDEICLQIILNCATMVISNAQSYKMPNNSTV